MLNLNPSELKIEMDEEILEKTVTPKKTEWCICKVPDDLREVNKEAYTPFVVSIGPLHYGNERLQNMEIHKRVYLKQFVERTGTNLKDLVSFIEELEPSVRRCYADNIIFNTKQFVNIILLDACFIIELFLRDYRRGGSKDDALSPETRLSSLVLFDLLLLENQLPFFVLEKLFNWTFPSRESNNLPSFLKLTFTYFSIWNQQSLSDDGVNICHFTDLLRYFHLQQPSSRRPERIAETGVLNFSATKLHEVGLRFQVNESPCLTELQFSGGVLMIPRIIVEFRTEVLFRNVMAFERCHYPHALYIIDYVTIFCSLIKKDKDVDVLVRSGIIDNLLDDSHAVAKMFNGLGKNIRRGNYNFNSDYVIICRELNEFHRDPWQKILAIFRHDYIGEFKHDYCQTPLQSVATVGGILLVVLTVIQTICSIIQVLQKS